METKHNFWLLAGALLYDAVNFDNDLLCSNANITDDLALYHLKTNPNCRHLFQTLPDNVDELISAFVVPNSDVQTPISGAPITDEEAVQIQAQVDAENVVVAQIVEQLKVGATKEAIIESFSDVKTVGTKKLNKSFLIELVDRATAQIS